MTFSKLGLSEKVLQAVEASGYLTPTPIQAEAIPHVLAGRDVLGIAQTGTGKTAAFTLADVVAAGKRPRPGPNATHADPRPTRELAAQVEESFVRYGVNHKLNVALLIGGVSFGDQETKIMRGADVLIATPGRLLDFSERGKLLLTGIEILVIDEADRMLDMGFIPDIERICKLVPFTRQTLFFSATMPPEITRLTEAFLHNPVRIEVTRAASTLITTSQGLVASASGPAKRETLRRLIRGAADFKNAIIFCNRKRDVAILHKSLQKHGFNAGVLHGDMDQRARMVSLDAFKTGERRPYRLLGRRGAWPRHSRRKPCVQFRCPNPCRGLRSSNWPHGTRGQNRHRTLDRYRRRSKIHFRNRAADRPENRLARGRKPRQSSRGQRNQPTSATRREIAASFAAQWQRRRNLAIKKPTAAEELQMKLDEARPPKDPFSNIHKRREHVEQKLSKIPLYPDEDLLMFIRNHNPNLTELAKDLLTIVHEEAQYFVPQIETKIMNEGWASFCTKRFSKP